MNTVQEINSILGELDQAHFIAFIASTSHTIPELSELSADIIKNASSDDLLKAETVLEKLSEIHPDDESYREGYQLVNFARLVKLHPEMHKTVKTMLVESATE